MGGSGKAKNSTYSFVDHARYLDAWFDALGLRENITLVVHDWGSALGFSWVQGHPDQIKGPVYMEALVRPVTWHEWPEQARSLFQAMRSPAGEQIILEKNVFVERILPASVMRHLSDEEVTVKGIHIVQEDSPVEIGAAIASFYSASPEVLPP